MAGHPVVVAYNATEEAADGLALADLLVHLTDAELVIARVLRDMIERPSHGRPDQREIRRQVMETRRAVVAAVPDEADADIVPLLDPSLARSLHDLAESEDAAYLVVGSTHLRGLGRRLLGGSAQLVIDGAHCPVAVASPGFRSVREVAPAVVSIAYDGKPHSRDALGVAASLAAAARATLRVVTAGGDVPDDLPGVRLPPAEIERVALIGEARRALVGETANTGMLVMGSHGRGPVRRALLGSVSAHVVHHAHCPVVVCPPGA
ncbi:MAG TPA: universal stress protein [Solirubrobacteraceae bacterium]|nr:universal stress protein [Solirubrobacteraceae bacterium]HSD79984.1 universal stress protein [Solirubrobacteraceae bacterium]